MKHEKGQPIIDELKMCFIANTELLEELKTIDYDCCMIFPDYTLRRTACHHFEYAFDVYPSGVSESQKVATGLFGRFGDRKDSCYFFYRVENRILYKPEIFSWVVDIPLRLGMKFHNYTSLDIAIDTDRDMARMMKRLWHRDDVVTIINGKAVTDRKGIVPELRLVYSTSLERMKGLTVYVKQRKAANNKKKGITIQAYNKRMEIDYSSNKTYISEYYGSPQRLFRLEVHLNHDEISDYCKSHHLVEDETLIHNPVLLKDMFYYHLSAVIRFSKRRKKISWEDIIESNGRV